MKTLAYLFVPVFAGNLSLFGIAAEHGNGSDALAPLFLLVLLASIVALYFAPALIAHSRGRANAGQITVLNVFAGWTGIGWIVALVWAFGNDATHGAA